MRVRQEEMSGRRSAGNMRTKRRRRMRARHIQRNKSEADLGGDEDGRHAENDRVEVRDRWPGSCQDIDWAGLGMRMIRFHVHDPLVIRTFQLREVRMNQRRPAAVGMYMKQRSVSRSKNQG